MYLVEPDVEKCFRIVLLIFVSGKVVLTGAKVSYDLNTLTLKSTIDIIIFINTLYLFIFSLNSS